MTDLPLESIIRATSLLLRILLINVERLAANAEQSRAARACQRRSSASMRELCRLLVRLAEGRGYRIEQLSPSRYSRGISRQLSPLSVIADFLCTEESYEVFALSRLFRLTARFKTRTAPFSRPPFLWPVICINMILQLLWGSSIDIRVSGSCICCLLMRLLSILRQNIRNLPSRSNESYFIIRNNLLGSWCPGYSFMIP